MTLQRDAQNKIQIELDTKIKEHLAQYGEDRGWTLEETIRYILGKYVVEYTAVVPMMSNRGFLTPPQLQGPEKGPESWIDNYLTKFSTMIGSMGLAKCRKCLQLLSGDDINRGECSNCGERI